MDLDCPECHHHWDASFDAAAYFWTELNAWAERRLHEIHTLASAYGWSEKAILELGPTRRRIYLQKVDA